MLVASYLAPFDVEASFTDWLEGTWSAGVSPVNVFDPVLGGFVVVPSIDTQLAVPETGPFAGTIIRLMGPSLSLSGTSGTQTPLPDSGIITGLRIYGGYAGEVLIFDDDPNLDGDTSDYRVLNSDGTPFAGPQLLEAGGVSIDVADLHAAADPGLALRDALLEGLTTVAGSSGNDVIATGPGDDVLGGLGGSDTLDGGAGEDTAVFDAASTDIAVRMTGGDTIVTVSGDADTVRNVEMFQFTDTTLSLAQVQALVPAGPIMGTEGNDRRTGDGGDNVIRGLDGDDVLIGLEGADTLEGGDGADTLNGGDGNDRILGGASDADLRDVVYAGSGDDDVDAGHGNDQVFGQEGNDTIAGGFGADELRGQDGDDVLTGGALSDLIFGGDGNDFVNGGFGYDRINGGDGADRFFHLGVADHGSDWVQDYDAAEGDVLVFGGMASSDRFQVNLAHTETPDGVRSGDAAVQEAFVIDRSTGQILWALVDGEGQDQINIQIGGEVFDLMA